MFFMVGKLLNQESGYSIPPKAKKIYQNETKIRLLLPKTQKQKWKPINN